jgi:hypothetical protein
MTDQVISQRSHGGRMTKWKGRAASMAPGMLSVSVIALSAGLSLAETVISTPLNAPQIVAVDENVTVTAAGSVALTGESSEQAIEINVADYTSDVLIQGTLSYIGGTASFTAAGLSLTGNLSGTITNQGVITLSVLDTDDVTLVGIEVQGDVSGTITNAGTISVYGNAQSDASVSGVTIYGDLSGTVRNDGTIAVEAISGSDSASAWGIYVDNVTGTALIENNGTITARAFTFTSSAEAYGIQVDGPLDAGARIVNNGLIDVEAESVTYSAYAYGIDVNGDAAGSIANTGQIVVRAIGTNITADTMEAYGIYVDGSLSGTITNDGLISIDVDTLADQYSIFAGGIVVGDVAVGGVIANNDTITVAVQAEGVTDTSTIVGIGIGGAMVGSVTNDGAISITVDVDSVTSSSLFVYGIGIDGTIGGSISNSGTIDVVVNATSASYTIAAYGIAGGGDIGGSISNAGTINVAVTLAGSGSLYTVEAYGIDGGNVLNGAVVENSGSIVVSATATGINSTDTAEASAYGISVFTVDGALTNGGTIDVTATANGTATDGIYAYAYGIETGFVGVLGSITNDGSITVAATADGTAINDSIYASAYGMELSTIDGTVSNGGSIDVQATATGFGATGLYVFAYGIEASTVNGSLTNDGSITVVATASGTATNGSLYATAYGMEMSRINGTVSNGGTIAVTATASGFGATGLYVSAYGIEASTVNGSLTNDGSITVIATAEGDASSGSIYATAFGMELSDINGTVSNGGSINVQATANGSGTAGVSAWAYGIEADGVGVLGSVTNDGSIMVTATANGTATNDDIFARAYGMVLFATNDGTLDNNGSISVSAVATGSGSTAGTASAFGMEMGTVSGTGSVSNTGSIIVSAEASNDNLLAPSTSLAVGIDIDTLNGSLFNSGVVMASVANDGEAFAVRVLAGTGDAEFTTEGFFAGRLRLLNDDVTVRSVADTGSVYWTFEDRLPDSVTIDDANGPTLYYDAVNNIVATVEPANLAFSGQIAGELADMGADTVAALLAGTPATGAVVFQNTMATSSPMMGGGMTGFVQGDYLSRQVDDAAGRELDFDVAGLTAGFVGQMQNGLGYGVTLSGVNADGSVRTGAGADRVDTNGVVLGVYGNADLGAASMTFGATFGMLSNDGRRSVNDNLAPGGVSTVDASYDSTFVSPSIELSYAIQSGAATIRPHMGYRYTRLNVDGFTETGGGAAATFGSRDVDVSDFTIGADASMAYGGGVLTGSAEILRRNVSDDGANVAIFGIGGSTASASTDFTALNLGIGYGVALGSGMMNVGVSGMVGTNGVSGYGVKASYSVRF